MGSYRLYHVERRRKLRFDDFTAGDDRVAMAEARRRVDGGDGELWDGTRLVSVIRGS